MRAHVGTSASIERADAIGGGCIGNAQKVCLTDGRCFFVKSKRKFQDAFDCEADGLRALGEYGPLGVPKIIAVDRCRPLGDCLVLGWIDTRQPGPDFYRRFGRGLAELHHRSQGERCGWERDNYLGASRQINDWGDDWCDFFAAHRLGFQIKMACDQGLATQRLVNAVDSVCGKLGTLLADGRQHTSLLHGDLWNGNFLCDADDRPVIIDPAVYFGNREAELAMPLLFGGFPQEFFEAYHERFALVEGWQDRVEIYKLYHLLNHLNLFGSGYLDDCLRIALRFA